ncbi:MAG: hypothetical protein ACO38Y_12915 [Steroidobacteraceae bacterium]
MARCTPELIDQRAFDYYPRLSRLRNYCLNHLDGPISLGEAAAQASLERTYFSTYFHLKVGVCFGCWLTCQRINQARLLLRSSEVSITEVAASVVSSAPSVAPPAPLLLAIVSVPGLRTNT